MANPYPVIEEEEVEEDPEEVLEEEFEEDPEEIEQIEEEEEQQQQQAGGETGLEIAEEEGWVEEKEVVEPTQEKRKQKEFEVFVGGLPRDATEADLEKVFEKVGDVVEVNLVKNPHSRMNKGFAFVRFATVEQAKRAATELQCTKVKGKVCGVIRSKANETLHLRNICTVWTKDDLMKKLETLELENLEEVNLIQDPYNEGKNRGFAFLDFRAHMDAVAACCKLQKRDIFLGTDVRAEVSFSRTVEPGSEIMAQVKSVFLDGIPSAWDEAKLRQHFKEFGEIQSVQLSSQMPTAKRKDFGFISFTTRRAALDCIAKVNRDGIAAGTAKFAMKATLKKPLVREVPLGFRGGHIRKSRAGKRLYHYDDSDHFSGRPPRSREFVCRGSNDKPVGSGYFPSSTWVTASSDRPEGSSGFSSSTRVTRANASPLKKHVSCVRKGYARNLPASACSSARHAPPSHQDFFSMLSRHKWSYPGADDIYDPPHERYQSYEHHPISGYRRSHSEIDLDRDPRPSSFKRHCTRSNFETSSYTGSAHAQYSRFLPDDHMTLEEIEYKRKEHRRRYFPGSGSSRSYY